MTDLKHNNASTLTNNKTRSVLVEWSTRFDRVIVPVCGQTSCSCKSRYGERMYTRLGASSDHDICVTKLDQASGIPDTVCTSCAGSSCRVVWAFEAMPHRNMACSKVDQQPGHEKRRDLAIALRMVSEQ
jgi:hypothetical protein